MNNTAKINSTLRTLVNEGYSNPLKLYTRVLRTANTDGLNTYSSELWFYQFYISVGYRINEGITHMSLYTNRTSCDCPVLCIERNGDILVGNATSDDIRIFNGVAPCGRSLRTIGADQGTYAYMCELHEVLKIMVLGVIHEFSK